MLERSILAIGIGVLLGVLGADTAQATVKCQCNNGTIAHAMSVDYDDDDLDEACNDACSMSGGGRVWNVDTDRGYGGDEVIRDRVRPPAKPAPDRR